MKHRVWLFAVLAVSLSFSACGGGGTPTPTTTALKGLATCTAVAGEGVICGTAYAPDGQTPLVGVEVKQVTSGAMVVSLKGVAGDSQCLTDATGAFACSGIGSGGTQNFQIIGGGYTTDFSAGITLGDTTNIPATSTTAEAGSGTKKYIVVSGSFDSIENVLARVLQCGTVDANGALEIGTECSQLELVDFFGTNPNTALSQALGLPDGTYPTLTQLLTDANAASILSGYDGIFFNCGCDESLATDSGAQEVLRTYVSDGGNVYGSDWAYLYIENIWPDAVDWHGDDTMDSARVGNVNSAQPVNVEHSGLLAWLRAEGLVGANDTTFNVNFNLGGWVVMTDSAATTNEILTANSLPNGPADVPVAPRTTLPITVDFAQGSGCVFYTSYHNEPAGEVDPSAAQARVLEYLLLNRFGNCS